MDSGFGSFPRPVLCGMSPSKDAAVSRGSQVAPDDVSELGGWEGSFTGDILVGGDSSLPQAEDPVRLEPLGWIIHWGSGAQ